MKLKSIVLFLVAFFSVHFLSAQCISGDCQNGKGTYVYASGAKYTGEFKEGEIHGIGVCYYTDGSKYSGQWGHRFPEGRGTKTLANGMKWTGKWAKGQPIDDQGDIIDDLFNENIAGDDGTDIQSGCVLGDCENGEGTFAYANGSRYEGQFQSDLPDGWGTFYDVDGEKYIGTFSNGVRDGKGTLYYPDGSNMTGEWRGGEYFGSSLIEKGQYGCVDGDCENGRGTYIYKDGAAKYTGQFKNRLPHGIGMVNYANGERYSGKWAEGYFNGKGTLFQIDGTQVDGYWKNGTYAGKENPNTKENPVVADVMQSSKELEKKKKTPAEKQEDLAAIRNASKMKVWAVVVGVAAYNHMPTLRYTDDDAYRMYAFLKSPEGGAVPDEQIRILIDEDATKVKMERTMEEIFTKAGPDDLVMLYFSGHGLKGSFVPIDFDGFNNKLDHEEVNAIFNKSRAKYKLCIADACHSGSLLAMNMKSGNTGSVLENYYKTLAQADPGTALIMSSKSEETSLESSGLRQGVFSHFLIRGLKGEADSDQNKIVTVDELYTFIFANVRTYTGNRQSPVIKGDYDPKMTVSSVR